ncbi:zinc finger protein ZAT18-like [Phragmites australis]|uniref:zinc finger protein ZAT18-like n=1 Tax=Phragmites australis TaxID=29695 RepID=UPI002D777B99|nr:zinc finger protein ZAT18-like [Phragmites australis]
MDVDTARTTAPAAITNAGGLLLFLSLSLSPASRAIAKGKQRARVEGAFQCRTCGRRFATFQALGGHRTSHKRPRVRADGLDLLLGARPGKGAGRDDVHRCHTCGDVFTTGQALGGHMRRHRAAFDIVHAPETMTNKTSSLSVEGDDADPLPTSTLIHFI